MCVGNEVEILALEIGSEPGPEACSAMAIAKNNGSIQFQEADSQSCV